MTKFEELLAATKWNDLMNRKEDEQAKKAVLWGLAVVGAVAAVAGIAYAVYRIVTPDYLEDFEEEFDDFEDDIFEDDTEE